MTKILVDKESRGKCEKEISLECSNGGIRETQSNGGSIDNGDDEFIIKTVEDDIKS